MQSFGNAFFITALFYAKNSEKPELLDEKKKSKMASNVS